MVLSAWEESAAELLCENVRGDSSKTVTQIDLKTAQWNSEPMITLYTKFQRNLRGRVLWPGRFVLERPCLRIVFKASGIVNRGWLIISINPFLKFKLLPNPCFIRHNLWNYENRPYYVKKCKRMLFYPIESLIRIYKCHGIWATKHKTKVTKILSLAGQF